MDIIHKPSPNFDERPAGVRIDSIVIHYSGMACVEDVIAHFGKPESKVSSHYTICREGRVFQHVPDEKRAWHAGKSRFGAREEFNHFSIGIELYNPGHNRGYIPYSQAQIKAMMVLIDRLYRLHPIDPQWVLGHSDIAPDRKIDPGEFFPWDRLVSAGLAIRPRSVPLMHHKIG